jgi:sulfide:quinone oxidoreductase
MRETRILILGGGVGGTLTANLLARQLSRGLRAGDVTITVVDTTGVHTYQPGFMDIALGGQRAEHLQRPERGLLPRLVKLVVGQVEHIDESSQTVRLADGRWLGYDYLVLATGSRIVPEEIEHFGQAAHHFYSAEAALALRGALDSFSGGHIVIGAAGMPYKCPPAPLEAAFLIEAELRERGIRDQSEVHLCSPIDRAFSIEAVSDMATPILEQRGIELHTCFDLGSIDPEHRVLRSLEGVELPYDLLILVPPHKGQQFLIDSGLAPAPGGWLPTDRATLQVGDRRNVYALGDATDLPWSKTGSTAHFEAPVVTERIAAAVLGRHVDTRQGEYMGEVMCFFEVGDGKGTMFQFDYAHPPKPPEPNQLWHLGKVAFDKTYWHTVPKGRV